MAFKIVILALCAVSVTLTFKSEWVLKKIFNVPEPTERAVMIVKLTALLLAVLLFIAVFRV